MNKITITEEEYFDAIFENSDRFRLHWDSDFQMKWGGDKSSTKDIILFDTETKKYYITYARRGISDSGEYWFEKDMAELYEAEEVEVITKEWKVKKDKIL